MCTDPITKIDAETGQKVTFACRRCDDCLASRINDWVARGVAEKATAGETLVVRLSYRNNEDGTKPDGAITFRYADVQVFLKKLRERYFEHYEARGEIRYLVCGERGSKKDRVHYHCVLFSDKPISVLGEYSDMEFKPLDGIQIDKRPGIHWSMWDHGHVLFQIPDQGGIRYALKYALSDQFNAVKSKGTNREGKVSEHAAGVFRMSKKPPIGFRWLERKCDEWERRLLVPPNLQLKPPEYKGFWWPKGAMREYLLLRLHEINEKCRREYGRDAAAWDALLSSVLSHEKDWELLYYGEIEEEAETYDKWKWQEELGHADAATRKRCGGVVPCSRCRVAASAPDWLIREYTHWRAGQVAAYVTDTESSARYSFDEWYRQKREINPFCGRDLDPSVKQAFEA